MCPSSIRGKCEGYGRTQLTTHQSAAAHSGQRGGNGGQAVDDIELIQQPQGAAQTAQAARRLAGLQRAPRFARLSATSCRMEFKPADAGDLYPIEGANPGAPASCRLFVHLPLHHAGRMPALSGGGGAGTHLDGCRAQVQFSGRHAKTMIRSATHRQSDSVTRILRPRFLV